MTRFVPRFAAMLVSALVSLAIGAGGASAAGEEQRALATTQQLLASAHQALESNDTGALRNAIENAFDFDIWERFLIQGHEAAFSPQQEQRFRQLLPGYLAYLYQEQFDKGLATPTVGDARPARNDVLVSATFKRANGRDLPVDWRLRDISGKGMRVIDVMVGGTSFLLLKRSEFSSIIEKGGADALLQYMQQHSL